MSSKTKVVTVTNGSAEGPVPKRTRLNKDPVISEIFQSLEYGPAPEAPSGVNAWLDKHGRSFGHFINGKWVKPKGRKTYESKNPATGEVLASTTQGEQKDIEQAVAAAKEAFQSWSKTSGHVRARHIYSIARHVQKHARLIAVLESMDNGKPIRETRDCDIPNVARHLYHYAGWAQLMETEMRGWKPIGVVGGIVPWNFPLMLLCWKVCPAIAMGNTVVLKPATYTRLSALLFAEICAEAGLPPGVFNVVTGNGAFGSSLATHPDVDKVAFTGSTEVGKVLRQVTAGTGKKLSLELGGKSPFVVFDTADLDSAVEGVVDAIWFNQGQVCSAGSRLIVQETCASQMILKLKERMSHLRLGDSLDKCVDMGTLVDPQHLKSVAKYVEEAQAEGAEVYQNYAYKPSSGCFYPPTLITNVQPVSKIVIEEVFGPVLAVLTFRTPKEAIAIANNTNYGLGASVWSENLSLCLEVAISLKAGAVWVNGHNLFDAAAGFGGYRESGYGRDGGKEGLYEYVSPSWQDRPHPDVSDFDVKTFGAMVPASVKNPNENPVKVSDVGKKPSIDHTYKMYIGGAQKRPDGNYSNPIVNTSGEVIAQVADGNRKDIRDAVEAAHKAAPGWGKRAAHNRAQIVYYMAENLEMRHNEIAQRLTDMTGCSLDESKAEVDATIERLFHYGAYADKYGGTVQETPFYGATVKIHEPVGVIGIACPDESPLLAFVSLLAPAVIRGNTVIVVPSEKYPLVALDMYQVFDTSDLPAGVVNIVTGNRDHLTKYLTEHQDVQSMWYFGTPEGSKFVEHASAVNVKRTLVNYGLARNWLDKDQGQGEEFLYHATECKNIWLPMGDIFAN
ncbi:aldehyde dehydrogenase family 16 member A1 [Exaiptasia diaphana]|uniref:Aldehyde dehydrogenase domain-containing protein n=1 Tax=Exaiptasia diaphana TaxID=2652724 RepID=A0A913XI78_EXADI|nr:aldehyde dehydrogenase family 16 member A1 [Exaiptasia diaphana]KXJ06145.1 Aldehyde dehydrogenase family 16 member A1 [Exaiptasia diaphana]